MYIVFAFRIQTLLCTCSLIVYLLCLQMVIVILSNEGVSCKVSVTRSIFYFFQRITLKNNTSNALVALVKAEQHCLKELFEAVSITRQIPKFIWQCNVFQTVGPPGPRPEKPGDGRTC